MTGRATIDSSNASVKSRQVLQAGYQRYRRGRTGPRAVGGRQPGAVAPGPEQADAALLGGPVPRGVGGPELAPDALDADVVLGADGEAAGPVADVGRVDRRRARPAAHHEEGHGLAG